MPSKTKGVHLLSVQCTAGYNCCGISDVVAQDRRQSAYNWPMGRFIRRAIPMTRQPTACAYTRGNILFPLYVASAVSPNRVKVPNMAAGMIKARTGKESGAYIFAFGMPSCSSGGLSSVSVDWTLCVLISWVAMKSSGTKFYRHSKPLANHST